MRRPIDWITVSISLFFLVLGLSLRDKPRTAPVDLVTASPADLLAFPALRREPLTFERISLDSPAAEATLLTPRGKAQPLSQPAERVANVSPALMSFETTWYSNQPKSLRTP